MARKVFYSFHFKNDCWRTGQVRNIGSIEGNKPVSDNNWEEVKKGGDKAIQQWIDQQMQGRSCIVVLVGEETATRKWVKYEIERSWKAKKGIVGIRIHNLKDQQGNTSKAGANPFDHFTLGENKLSSIVKLKNPTQSTSTGVYQHIADNIEDWIEEAIEIRNKYN